MKILKLVMCEKGHPYFSLVKERGSSLGLTLTEFLTLLGTFVEMSPFTFSGQPFVL